MNGVVQDDRNANNVDISNHVYQQEPETRALACGRPFYQKPDWVVQDENH
jgi:hypothetical protein